MQRGCASFPHDLPAVVEPRGNVEGKESLSLRSLPLSRRTRAVGRKRGIRRRHRTNASEENWEQRHRLADLASSASPSRVALARRILTFSSLLTHEPQDSLSSHLRTTRTPTALPLIIPTSSSPQCPPSQLSPSATAPSRRLSTGATYASSPFLPIPLYLVEMPLTPFKLHREPETQSRRRSAPERSRSRLVSRLLTLLKVCPALEAVPSSLPPFPASSNLGFLFVQAITTSPKRVRRSTQQRRKAST